MNSDLRSMQELVEKLVDNSISASEQRMLQGLLSKSPELRQEYIRETQLHASLQVYADVEDSRNLGPPFVAKLPPSRDVRITRATITWLALIACCLCLLAYLYLNESRFPLTVVAVENIQPMHKVKVGDKVTGSIAISAGLLTLTTEGGSFISLEGPVKFKMKAQNVGRLEYGRLVAFCGEDAEKLIVETPNVQYTDLGTEFGVEVSDGVSSLHVFDGLVMASESSDNAEKPVLVEAASSLKSTSDRRQRRGGMADLVSFDSLRKSLSQGGISEGFKTDPLTSNPKSEWDLSFESTTRMSLGVENSNPLALGLGSYYQFKGTGKPSADKKDYSSATISFEYGKLDAVDLTRAHTVECVIRLDCDPQGIRDLMLFGGDQLIWQKRAWEVRAIPNDNNLLWSIYNPKRNPFNKYQYLKTEKGKVYHLLVEIDPVAGRYRKTISDGENRIWSALSDGSPARLKKTYESIGVLHWRIRGYPGKEIAFSIDGIKIRNRPVFETH